MQDLSQRYTLSIAEAVQYFGISKSLLWRWISDGLIKAHKPKSSQEGPTKKNRKVLLIRKEVEKFITKSQLLVPDAQ